MPTSRIAVIGAAGHTGRFVVKELARRGFEAIVAGRDQSRLQPLASRPELVRIIDIEDAASLDRAIEGADAVINCAGPFMDTAIPVIDAALKAGIPYLDVTAEQPAVRDVIFERHEAARAAGVTIVPAAAFYGGLADLLVSAVRPALRRIDEIAVAVALDSWHPTEGTRLTGKRNTAARVVRRNGEMVALTTPQPPAHWAFPEPFGQQEVMLLPFSETLTLAHHLEAPTILSWINSKAIADIRDPETPAPVATDARGRSPQRFVMDVVLREGDQHVRITASGRDIYAASAPIIVEAASRLLAGRADPGVRTLGELFDGRSFLQALGSDRVEFEIVQAAGSPLAGLPA